MQSVQNSEKVRMLIENNNNNNNNDKITKCLFVALNSKENTKNTVYLKMLSCYLYGKFG